MTSRPIAETARNTMLFREIVSIAIDSFRTSKVRFVLTALGMVIGTGSLIMVVTIGLTGKQYVMNQIQAIGANLIYAYYEAGSNGSVTTGGGNDYLTVEDMRAVQQEVPGIQAASPMIELHDRIGVGGGKERDILVLGVSPQYSTVRNLEVLAGRFFDDQDSMSRAHVALVTQQFATRVFGGQASAIDSEIKINGLPFVIVGTFRERVETFGQSEIAGDTVLIPASVGRYFTGNDAVKQLFFSVSDAGDVPRATEMIQQVLQSRHRPESVYRVENLTQLLQVAGKTANALTLVLLAIALVTLIVSGVGIMNIMLANVRTRIREIGIRKAIGATNREIRLQFLTEAVLISLSGGVVGTVLGLAVPFSVRFLTEYRIPISGLSAIIAIFVATLVGVIFGTVPATRAAQLDPVEALHYE
ncbi:MAG TPA: ABC transporter permease [Candidatus Limnocylindrales bacterium]|jgi:putative ABC transport system permease protein|nr:ABC transporter permease [Candidatus Limnocylindrales bacterium]